MALEVIGGKWYGTINVSAEKTSDFIGALNGLVIAEIAELDAISGRRVESSRVKSLLSTREDRYRPPYGRTTRVFKRTAVLVGTTNEIGWHKDETGGRRFWPIECLTIDIEWLKANREQLFAEALHRYRQSEKWWDVPEDEQRRRIMEHHTTRSRSASRRGCRMRGSIGGLDRRSRPTEEIPLAMKNDLIGELLLPPVV